MGCCSDRKTGNICNKLNCQNTGCYLQKIKRRLKKFEAQKY